ncbi:RagB/SusD family nutrient uptake outer membrane protein [uncultured Bacteroides sp.]|uniref:RagB/SusD family nutrient uptake outer membrane protein n=1 Tax=uncultured Bacteroides sp. TaxID=162156 RepID=UPI0025E396D5|nr:RagB/SusD family nutrient uptake outer membrane protein [uncultured Bacteroides sp.]
MSKYILCVSVSLCLLVSSCLNDEFLEVYPKGQQTEGSVFTTNDNFKTYAWGLYNVFFGYTYDTGQTDEIFRGDFESDNMIKGLAGYEGQWAYRKAKATDESKDWDYDYIRRVNLMLDNIDNSEMNETEKEHWRSVGYFFRSYKYFQMLSKFGGIPWVEHALTEESPELYGKRNTRDLVASNILSNLKYAEEHIGSDILVDGKNTINVYVVKALISRFALFEGTWRKYHGLSDADTYLKECARAAGDVIEEYPDVHPRYDELFNSETLDGVAGILLYKAYETGQLMHGLTRMVRTGESNIEATKDAVDSYLCKDGRPVSTTTSNYGGDKNIYGQFRDRDYRLYLTICPPYLVKKDKGPSTPEWQYTDNAEDREFMDLMATISGETYHRLPSSNFKGFTVQGQPHFKNMNWGQGWNASQMGFWVWKYYNTHTVATNANGVNTTDAPLFRVGEVMVNYAEAMCELGKLDQPAADRSINKLRSRAGVAKMIVDDISDDFDTDRDPSVPALLWEVRRERRVELMGEGFRLDDLRRWKKGEYVNKQALGAYVTEASAKKLKVTGGIGADDGYVYFYDAPLGWQEHYYLYPLPLKQLALNTKLEQNPVWTK